MLCRQPGHLAPRAQRWLVVGSRKQQCVVPVGQRAQRVSGPLVAESITFLGEQDLVSLPGGRISPCLDLSVARVSLR